MNGGQRYATAGAFRQALEARLQADARSGGLVLERLRKQVAFDRFLARLFPPATKTVAWVLKGGYALELRFEQARATRDIDLTLAPGVIPAVPVEERREALRRYLREFVQQPSFDFFEFLVGRATLDLEGAPDGGFRYLVDAVMDGRSFARFHVDIGIGDPVSPPFETLEGGAWLEFAGIARPQFLALSCEQQWAEKLHAYTRPRETRPNSRTKDLVDLVLLIKFGALSVARLKECVAETFALRATHSVPTSLPPPPAEWKQVFARLALEAGIEPEIDRAFNVMSEFWDDAGGV